MAKNEEKKAAKTAELSVDNVMDEIRSGNLIDTEIAKIGDEKDNEAERERKVQEYRKIKNKAKYQNRKALLMLRARRREEKVTKQYLDDTKTLLDDFVGSKLTVIEYEKKRKDIRKKRNDAMNESNDQYRTEIEELRNAFPGYWQYDWDD